MVDSVTIEHLNSLPRLSKARLAILWQRLFQLEPPIEMRRGLMLRIVAHRLQEQEFGGLSDASRRRLRQIAKALGANPDAVSPRAPIKPGTRLVRQWKEASSCSGKWNPKGLRVQRRSLPRVFSQIARLITGTRWSGPLFFGLKDKPSTLKEAK